MVKFNVDFLPNDLADAVASLSSLLGYDVSADGTVLKRICEDDINGLTYVSVSDECVIGCRNKASFFRLLGIALANYKKGFVYSEKAKADEFGFMTDCSRNAVQNIESLERLIGMLAVLGYNSLYLYTEDTYEIEGEPFFGYMRGRFSAEEIRDLDKYAAKFGIELIPCIQTLAHLNCICRWKYNDMFDCNDILLVDDERTYELIDKMLKTVSRNYSTRKVNIGMDEAYMLGRGKYLDKHGYRDAKELMRRHLSRVLQIAEKYGLKPMMWSDMFFSPDYYGDSCPDEEQTENIPDVDLVYWDYYHLDEKDYDRCIKKHLKITDNLIFAGGAWKWRGFAPANKYSIATTEAALKAAFANGIKRIFITGWGDNGGECSVFAVLPTLSAAARFGYNGDRPVKDAFSLLTGATEEEFLAVDLPNDVGPERPLFPHNPSKYAFYNDPFLRMYDSAIRPGDCKVYGEYAHRLALLGRRKSSISYVFKTLGRLCEVLELKYELGINTEKAYRSHDEKAIRDIIAVYDETIKRTERFLLCYRKQWLSENKPFGMEIQEIRIGGLVARLKSCRERLKSFSDGKIERIEELEEKVLDLGGKTDGYMQMPMTSCSYADIVSPASKLPLF